VTSQNEAAATDVPAVVFDPWFEDQAKAIRVHLDKMNKGAEKAEQHRISALEILKTVEKRLTADGKLDAIRFDLFKAKVCPELSTSQAYVKLAILTGKLSLEDHRAKQNKRQQKVRDKKKAVLAALGGPNGIVAGNGDDMSAIVRRAQAGNDEDRRVLLEAGYTQTEVDGKPVFTPPGVKVGEGPQPEIDLPERKSVSGDTKQVKKGSSEWCKGEILVTLKSNLRGLSLSDLRDVAAVVNLRLAELEAAAADATKKAA
jgi:hypothetical protein